VCIGPPATPRAGTSIASTDGKPARRAARRSGRRGGPTKWSSSRRA